MRGLWLSFLILFPIAKSSVCPANYNQISPGGDCYQIKTYYNYFATQYTPKSYDEATYDCNSDGGGLLASIHSKDDNDDVIRVNGCNVNAGTLSIGLRCTGKDCNWDDGTPVTYTNFEKAGPTDNGYLHCYTIVTSGYGLDNATWKEKDCGKQDHDCWVCRVKARTIDCEDGETEYKGGCVSVHSTPLDQKSAEAACPGGGHLVSIHSASQPSENEFYRQLAMAAGVTGTIYIGGQYSNGKFEWADKSYYNIGWWANGFPNTVFGYCVQMLLESEFGNQGQWTNIDCSVKQPYICFRDGSSFEPPSGPKADARCPPIQYFTGSGNIYSPNYPLSIPEQQNCEYVLGTTEGTRVNLKFTEYNCQSGTSLSLYDGLNSNQPFATFNTITPAANQSYYATSNVMKIVFSANGTSSPVGTGWQAEFEGIY